MQDASFVAMLKAFLTQKEGDASKFDELLADAVEVCNIDVIPERATRSKTATCRNIKQMLAKYCEEGSEAERSAHLVKALNTILKWKFVEPSVIFVHNDPGIVGCPTNPDYMKTKPDIILVSVSAISKWFGEEVYTFDDCYKAFSDGTPFDRNGASWSDVCQSWELEKDTLASADALTKTYAIPEPGSSSPSTTGEKRKAEDTPGGHRKRPRWDPPFILDGCNTSELPRPPPDLQCETYAAECFRSSWDITHTTVVYLSGSQLALSWYDPQGEITSNAIDIIDELPLFLVFISILGLCDGLSGVGKAKKTVETHGEIGDIRHFTAHLSGRRTFGADFARKAVGGTLPARVQNRPLHFLKVSWTAERAGYEPDIIQLALDRADTLLLSNCRNYVKDHLPWIVEHGDIEGTSTSIIRKLLGLDETGSRVQRWIISEKLSPLKVTATTPKDFYRAYWEIIRCHYLLWIIGISHGDISFSNCMFNTSTKKGILNDFDISLVMDPGAHSPPSSGQENMGTLPFMALDLLTENGYSGNVAHRYRHELESFMWVLAWAIACVSVVGSGDVVQEKMVPPFDGWVGVDHNTVRQKKNDFLYTGKLPSDSWLSVAAQKSLRRFMAVWLDFYSTRSRSMRLEQIWTEPDGHQLLEQVMETAGEELPKSLKDFWLKEEVRMHVAEAWAALEKT